MSAPHRIDVHQRVVPPFWAKALLDHGGDPSGPLFGDPSHTVLPQRWFEHAIGLIDSRDRHRNPVADERRDMARRVNENTSYLAIKRPDRFGNFATLPLPDIDGALRELEHALDTVQADGVLLLGNYADKYLGDAAFEPVWAEFHRPISCELSKACKDGTELSACETAKAVSRAETPRSS
jgi:6-methylsalicylate decarboxylase